jgi:hypothetical protein
MIHLCVLINLLQSVDYCAECPAPSCLTLALDRAIFYQSTIGECSYRPKSSFSNQISQGTQRSNLVGN